MIFFESFRIPYLRIVKKIIEKCGLFNNRCQCICDNSQKASIHTGQKCGPIEKIQIGMLDGGAMELSEICSTCISTVRHTGQKCGPVLM